MKHRISFFRRKTLYQGLLLILLVFIMYFPVLKADYIWDDDAYVVNNRNLQNTQGLTRIWLEPKTSPQYYPLVFSSFWIERQLFGLNPHISHLLNVCLHIFNALLLWAVLRFLGVGAAFFIALVFAIHPVHLESVAWITERKNVLSAFFYLLSMLAYLYYSLPPITFAAKTRWRSIALYLTGMFLFVCALLSKTVTATLPMILLSILWWKKEKLKKWDWLAIFPMFILGIVFGLSTVWLEVHHVGALGEEWNLSIVSRFLIAGRAVWFYIGKIIWPQALSFIYPRWFIDPSDIRQYIYPLALLLIGLGLWFFRKKTGKESLVAVFFFLCSIFPALGFFNVYPMQFSYVADHFQYLASIGIIALVIVCLKNTLSKLKLNKFQYVLMMTLVLSLIYVGRREGGKYNNLETLWNDTIIKNGDCWMAYNNLGTLKIKQKKYAEARKYFNEVLKIKPGFAIAFNNLGMTWMHEGNLKQAKENFFKAIAGNSLYAEAYNNLGVALGREQNFSEAIINYQYTLKIDPQYVMAHYNLANVWSRRNDFKEAEKHYREAIRIRPDFAMAYYYYGVSLLRQGRQQEALQNLAIAFGLKPDFSFGYFQVGNFFMEQGKTSDAITHYSKAIEIDPDYAEAHCNLGTALLKQFQLESAIDHFRNALHIKPNYAAAENNLGYALERQGKLEEAIPHYIQALKLAPNYQKAKENLKKALQLKTLHANE
ncbi:MAG: tetratricopeptide repeat protein [Candidatus Aminicenantes bacterium]|nr:tetratricopeptide repeat protein [Candidatus Aminicenantes bacterium]